MTRLAGLSGGIGSGKSTVAALLAKLGAHVIDADAIVHELQSPGSPVLQELAEAFGEGILDESGALDRAALGAIAFQDPDARNRLGSIMHPKVGVEMMSQLAAARDTGVGVIVLDIPLLFEGMKAGTGITSQLGFDATIVVHVPEALQIERQIARDGCTREEALRRIRAQLPIDEKREMADCVIDNAGSLEETERQVRELYQQLTANRSPTPPGTTEP
ncbi:MAG: dephospho-CoA kinase [Deltaproteobacteria bacterium]|nr:dephospho-CoA kinase [Deltaproteobacteria bacterium]MBW2398011.1 dephospho-CoA kinase [Deltaproteobacteria bacterium]MBW2667513.1 dephospho-CoA kinase [Deltaproteobacteria bacterium]